MNLYSTDCNRHFKYSFDESRNVTLTATQINQKCSATSSITAIYPRYKDYGHAAALGSENSTNHHKKWHCNGAIISDRFILSSRDCLNYTIDLVRLGSLGDKNPEIPKSDCPINYKTSQTFTHPTANIGLVRLQKSIAFNTFVRPACFGDEDVLKNVDRRNAMGLTYIKDNQENLETLIKLSLTDAKSIGDLIEGKTMHHEYTLVNKFEFFYEY